MLSLPPIEYHGGYEPYIHETADATIFIVTCMCG